MTPGRDDGPRRGRTSSRSASSTNDFVKPTGCLPMRTSLALAMRGAGVDHRVIHAVAGAAADREAARLESWPWALAHLANHGLVGTEPPEVTSIRRMSRRWS